MITVEELIKKLKSFDPNDKIVIYSESEIVRCFEITDISISEAELKKLTSGEASVLFGKSEISKRMVFLRIDNDI